MLKVQQYNASCCGTVRCEQLQQVFEQITQQVQIRHTAFIHYQKVTLIVTYGGFIFNIPASLMCL